MGKIIEFIKEVLNIRNYVDEKWVYEINNFVGTGTAYLSSNNKVVVDAADKNGNSGVFWFEKNAELLKAHFLENNRNIEIHFCKKYRRYRPSKENLSGLRYEIRCRGFISGLKESSGITISLNNTQLIKCNFKGLDYIVTAEGNLVLKLKA